MKKLAILLLLFLFDQLIPAHAQVNCVRNGSFEQYSSCPFVYDQIRLAKFWQPIDTVDITGYGPVCAPEYCNKCAPVGSLIGVPQGGFYCHYPRTGDGMMEIQTYFDNSYAESYQRDYAQGKLYTQLTAGKSYCITFFVTLAQGAQYAVNRIGAYLDNGAIDAGQDSVGCALPHPTIIPQVFTIAIIDDTLNWVKIQGNFTANGNERFISIGNFFDVDHTDTISTGFNSHIISTNFSHCLLDDVSVIASDAIADAGGSGLVGLGDTAHIGTYEEGMPCTWYVQGSTTPIGYGGGIWVHPTVTTSYVVALDLCNGITYDTMTLYVCPAGVSALSYPGDLIQLYPNPATNEVHIDHVADCLISVYDMTGKSMLSHTLTTDKAIINIETLPTGMYMVQVTDPKTGNKVVRRLVKS